MFLPREVLILLYPGLHLQAVGLDKEGRGGDVIIHTHLSPAHLPEERVSELLTVRS